MAYTRIHPIKATVHKTIKYICNENKTDDNLLISSFGTSAETAQHDFKYALSKANEYSPNKAYHLIQSFSPGEVTPEEAHAIGTELADKILEGKYSYVIATHTDKNHVHNHICFCSVDNIDHKKYHDCKKSYYRIRELNDEICKEHSLSVINESNEKGKKYNEWQAEKNGTSWKKLLRDDIDDAIKKSKSFEEFLLLIKAKGYEVKEGKYIAFKPMGCGNFIRGRDCSLGSEYTKERIQERIKYKSSILLKTKKINNYDISSSNLLDTNEDRFKGNPGLNNWANLQNLKIAASAYSKAPSLEELKSQYESKTKVATETKSTIISLEHKLRDLGEVISYAQQYIDNEPYHYRYQKCKDQERYYRNHDTQLVLFDGAKSMLERYGLNVKKLNYTKYITEFDSLNLKKDKLNEEYKILQKEISKIKKRIENIEEFTNQSLSYQNEKKRKLISKEL